MSLFDMLMT